MSEIPYFKSSKSFNVQQMLLFAFIEFPELCLFTYNWLLSHNRLGENTNTTGGVARNIFG